jgi:hypothetical protein
MKRKSAVLFLILTIFLILVFSKGILSENVNETTVVEANIIGFANQSGNVSDVSIEVPDYISFGNVTKDNPVSVEKHININNTGKVNITVTPMLSDPDEVIFSYLFFRTTKTTNHTSVPFTQIGDYSLNIKKPSPGGKTKEYCWISLDLTNFTGDIHEDLIGYRSEIVFLAMPQ